MSRDQLWIIYDVVSNQEKPLCHAGKNLIEFQKVINSMKHDGWVFHRKKEKKGRSILTRKTTKPLVDTNGTTTDFEFHLASFWLTKKRHGLIYILILCVEFHIAQTGIQINSCVLSLFWLLWETKMLLMRLLMQLADDAEAVKGSLRNIGRDSGSLETGV